MGLDMTDTNLEYKVCQLNNLYDYYMHIKFLHGMGGALKFICCIEVIGLE